MTLIRPTIAVQEHPAAPGALATACLWDDDPATTPLPDARLRGPGPHVPEQRGPSCTGHLVPPGREDMR